MTELNFDPDHTLFLDNNIAHVQVENVYTIPPYDGIKEDDELLIFLDRFERFLRTQKSPKVQSFITSLSHSASTPLLKSLGVESQQPQQ